MTKFDAGTIKRQLLPAAVPPPPCAQPCFYDPPLWVYSRRQYYNMIRQWGGWPLFQELLSVTKSVADKHGVSIPNVGVRWVLDRWVGRCIDR